MNEDFDELEQQNRINENNAKLVLSPKFIPLYPGMLGRGFTLLEACLYGYINFFLYSKNNFYCTNEQLAELFKTSTVTISKAIQKLCKEKIIEAGYEIKAGGGKIRFIKNLCPTLNNLTSNVKNINEINNKIINKKINTLHKCNDSEAEILQPLNSLSPVKEQTPTPLTPRPQKREDIDLLIDTIKGVCNELGVAYNSTKDRMFAKHILDTVAFGELCDKVGQDRITFATNILKASVKINYFKGACSGPMAIYQNYADVYNKTMLKHNKQNSLVGYLPGLNITQGQN